MPSRRAVTVVAAFVLAALPAFASPAAAVDQQRARHEATIAYWTPARMQAAKPRDFAYDRGRFVPAAKPTKPPKGSTSTGALWPDFKGAIYRVTGRVYFSTTAGNWICSGSVATDTETDRSIVLTAGHCAYDGQEGGFATNWMFIPEFDTNPTYTCANTTWGCWTADALVVHGGFADQVGFTATATLYDWAFAVVGNGGKSNSQLDTTVGSFDIQFRDYAQNTNMHATGYPAAGKYSSGSELVYCDGPVAYDPNNSNRTYRLACDMTGGSSGGPWLTGFDGTGNTGVLSSVNSYTYNGITAMHGPKFNTTTSATWSAALTATANTIVR